MAAERFNKQQRRGSMDRQHVVSAKPRSRQAPDRLPLPAPADEKKPTLNFCCRRQWTGSNARRTTALRMQGPPVPMWAVNCVTTWRGTPQWSPGRSRTPGRSGAAVPPAAAAKFHGAGPSNGRGGASKSAEQGQACWQSGRHLRSRLTAAPGRPCYCARTLLSTGHAGFRRTCRPRARRIGLAAVDSISFHLWTRGSIARRSPTDARLRHAPAR